MAIWWPNPFFCGIFQTMQATLTQTILSGANQTAAEMEKLVRSFSSDIGEKKEWPLAKFYNYVKNLEFRPDPQGHESISRPSLSMLPNWPWRDCDDKSILIGSFCFENGIPFKFQASSKRPDKKLHHVFVIAKIDGRECVLDATYPRNKLGALDEGMTYQTNLSGEIMNPTLSIFSGDETLGNPFSHFGRKIKNVGKKSLKLEKKAVTVSRKVKKAAHKILSIPGVRNAVMATPVGKAILETGKNIENMKLPSFMLPGSNQNQNSSNESFVMTETKERPKWLIPAAVGVGVLGLVLVMKKGNK